MLRVARFAARFGFAVAPETEALMRAIAAAASSRRLPPERVWQELARGLMEARPSRMLAVLRDCGALAQLLPEVDALYGVPQPRRTGASADAGVHLARALDYAAAHGFALPVRYAVLAHDLGEPASAAQRFGAPRRTPRGAQRAPRGARFRSGSRCRWNAATLRALPRAGTATCIARRSCRRPTLLDLLHAADALRRPERLDALLARCEARRAVAAALWRTTIRRRIRRARALAVVQGVDAARRARKRGRTPARSRGERDPNARARAGDARTRSASRRRTVRSASRRRRATCDGRGGDVAHAAAAIAARRRRLDPVGDGHHVGGDAHQRRHRKRQVGGAGSPRHRAVPRLVVAHLLDDRAALARRRRAGAPCAPVRCSSTWRSVSTTKPRLTRSPASPAATPIANEPAYQSGLSSEVAIVELGEPRLRPREMLLLLARRLRELRA